MCTYVCVCVCVKTKFCLWLFKTLLVACPLGSSIKKGGGDIT
jgi:hypothetical protein